MLPVAGGIAEVNNGVRLDKKYRGALQLEFYQKR
jgi:hypothetical protein